MLDSTKKVTQFLLHYNDNTSRRMVVLLREQEYCALYSTCTKDVPFKKNRILLCIPGVPFRVNESENAHLNVHSPNEP